MRTILNNLVHAELVARQRQSLQPAKGSEDYHQALTFLVAPIVSGHGAKRLECQPEWQEEKDASRFPSLNRKGKLGAYSIPMYMDGQALTDAQREEWQDRMTQLRQFAALAGISINAKDYSKACTCKASGIRTSSKGAEFDVTHTSRWDGGEYDATLAERARVKREHDLDKAIYPWMYDARGKRRVPQVMPDGSVAFGPRGRTSSVADLMRMQSVADCIVQCNTDAMATKIRQAETIRSGDTELLELIEAQRNDKKAQKRGKLYLPLASIIEA